MENETNVSVYTIKDRIKKKQQIAFRRFIKQESPSLQVAKYIGLNLFETRNYISEQMLAGMTWNNYGDIWVIDHIVPLYLFDLSLESECKLVWNYQNLMALFKADNLHKEGDLAFSVLLLGRLKDTEIVRALADRATSARNSLAKYL